MKKIVTISLAVFFFFLAGCRNDRIVELADKEDASIQKQEASSRGEILSPMGLSYSGQIVIKLTQSVIDDLKVERYGDVQLQSVPKPMSVALMSINAKQLRRLFPPAGKFEKRSRKEGLHLWYIVEFDENVSLSTAMNTLSNVDGVELVESMPVMELMSSKNNPADLWNNFVPLNFKRSNTLPFDDPLLSNQWHYNNTGEVNGGVEGADINLFNAWKISTGSSNVVVCVVDGGIDVNHVDLKDNLWVNTAELNGVPGKDDDGNGFVDDIHGYCFVANTGDLLPDDESHGTHVAGTIAARNNNGIGVAGVAGGDGTPNSGVRLQSAAIFRDGYQVGADGAVAIKYGADNGAVISQNSWGFPHRSGVFTIPSHLKAAIDYFTKYAGTDENGNQLPDSPMKGGLVIFAAGNDNLEFKSQPAAYEGVIAVAAMGPDFRKANYSTYGEWVDITAPGGDQDRFGTNAGVLSTLAKDIVHQEYGFYHGTSMACPHVSGVAALIVSKFGGPGFTNEDLKERLLASLAPLNIDETNNSLYTGKLGRGYIDAYAALTLENKKIAPKTPTFVEDKMKNTDFTSLTVYWKVPSDEDDGVASRYQLYYSSEPLSEKNYKKGTLLGPENGYINGHGLALGSEMNYFIGNLVPDTKYYFALVAYDRWGLPSKPAFSSVKTKKNTPPEITNMPKEPIVVIDVLGLTEYEFKIIDIDGHKWSYDLSGDVKGVSAKQTADGLKLFFRPVLGAGDYKVQITLGDELQGVSEYEIPFRVITVKAPVLKKNISSQIIGIKNEPLLINLAQYFEPQEYFTLKYKVRASDGSMLKASTSESGEVTLEGLKLGRTNVAVEVSNGYKSTRTNFEVNVVDDANNDVYSVWPLPIQTDLNIWLNSKHKSARVKLLSVNGELVFEQSVTPDFSGIARVDMKKVAPGSYTLQIETGNNTFNKGVLKR